MLAVDLRRIAVRSAVVVDPPTKDTNASTTILSTSLAFAHFLERSW